MDDTDEKQYQITVACPQVVTLEGNEKGSYNILRGPE
jgi:hypothetical protein